MTTPMRSQYLRIKKQFADTIVFFRLGDFYETFDDDARVVSRVCDIVLTSRPVGQDERVPLAGVPYHAAEGYIAKLLQAGHRVAIVEQVGEIGQGLVDRDVVRIVTPGTVVEPSLLDDRRNNYIAAIVVDGNQTGLSYADITTGELAATQWTGEGALGQLRAEIARLHPAEIVTCSTEALGLDSPSVQPGEPAVTSFGRWAFELETARQALQEHLDVHTLDGFGLGGLPLAVRAAGGMIRYLAETQRAHLGQLSRLFAYSTDHFMVLDESTRRNLELSETLRRGAVDGSLLGVLDRTVTSMGSRLLRRWIHQPLLDLAQLRGRQERVAALVDSPPVRTRLRTQLKGVSDLERLTSRAVQNRVQPRELLGVRRSIEALPQIRELLMSASVPALAPLGSFDPCEEVARLISEAIGDDPPATLSAGGVIRPGFSAELDNVAAASRDAREWVADLEPKERARTGIRNLKVGYNRVFGYYLEVTTANAARVPAEYIRKQTLVNAERYITPELKEYEALILNAQEHIQEIERRIYSQVLQQITAASGRLLAAASSLSEIDATASLAEVAQMHRYVRPELSLEGEIQIAGGRHPVVEMTQRDEPFVPNDVRLSEDECILVITGPNMSGKSTYLRQVALIVLMAQIGSFVPADEARIGLVDRIFTRIGAQDEISAGQSTFMVEMVETANLLNHATPRSLLILDEVGRGTSTYDGISIAWAVVEHIHNHPRLRCKTLFATHYHELTQLSDLLPHVRNYNVAVAEERDKVVFLRRIVPGGADRSYGIHVALLAGLPRPVIHRAEEILLDLEKEARAPGALARVPEVRQLPLFSIDDPLRGELLGLDVSTMTPLEAISKLYELQKRAAD